MGRDVLVLVLLRFLPFGDLVSVLRDFDSLALALSVVDFFPDKVQNRESGEDDQVSDTLEGERLESELGAFHVLADLAEVLAEDRQ